MIQVMKKQGLKAALPLLLLATACGDGTTSASSFDGAAPLSSDAQPAQVAAADTSAFNNGVAPVNATVPAADVVDTPLATITLPVLTPSADKAPEKVPEPKAIAGLAVAALGLIVVKRKQAA